jgi:hypothetical protein
MFRLFLLKLKTLNCEHNPLYHWWKVCGFFKMPKLKFYIGRIKWIYGYPLKYNKYLSINTSSVGWKDKFRSPRFEWNPYILITILNKYQISLTFYYIPEHTWEAILDILYYNKSIKQAIENNVWIDIRTKEEIGINSNLKKYVRP